MDVKVELLKGYIADYITKGIDDFHIDADKICDSLSCEILAKIQNIINKDDLSDVETVEQIVQIMETYNIDCGTRHDF